MKAVLLNRL